MALIRLFEDRAAELFREGVIFGTAHSCVGQEAIAVGAAGVMRETDYLVGHHRSHGHLIAAGADLRRMMAEMFGKQTGYCKGLGGSMHIADLSLQILGCNGIVGAGLPHATGAALTAQVRGTGQAVVAFFGDGAAAQGAAHEAMNLAATWSLPVVFVCENNQFALTAHWRTQRAVEDLAERAAGYGMPGEVVDGNDLVAVEDAVARALARARDGRRPDVPRDEDLPAHAALHAGEPARHPRRGARRRVGGEGPAPAPREPAAGARRAGRRAAPGDRARRRARGRERDRDRARRPGRGPRRPPPRRARAAAEPSGAGGRDGADARLRRRRPRGARARARGRPGRDPDGRGHRHASAGSSAPPRVSRSGSASSASATRRSPRAASSAAGSAPPSRACGRSSSCSSPTSPASPSTRS